MAYLSALERHFDWDTLNLPPDNRETWIFLTALNLTTNFLNVPAK
jgi:hypothetical protein